MEKEDLYWVIFFLIPFALFYGVLGRVYVPVYVWIVSYGTPVFDHHLSFLWVAFILALLIACFRKRKSKQYVSSSYFIAEITTIIIIFQFCSNLKKYQFIKHENIYLLFSIYIGGLFLIGGLYSLSFYVINSFIKSAKAKRSYIKIGILLIVVATSLVCFYSLNHKSHIPGKEYINTNKKHDLTPKKVPQVILIVLDTVRADRLSLYSNHTTTKNLEAFSQGALVFENCVAPAPHTVPSHASIFTGLYPGEHGSHGNLSAEKRNIFGFPVINPLSEKFSTLAEILADNGYKTAGIVSNAVILNPELRLDQGFQIADTSMNIGHIYQAYAFRPILHLFSYISNLYPKYTLSYRTADDITRESINILKRIYSNPFFLFINYLDAHEPYRPPRPFHGYFLEKTFPQIYRLEQYLRRFIVKKYNRKDWISYQLSQYDGEIAYLDTQLGKLFSSLKEMGMYDASLIIVTSDHGELFGTHGFFGHKTPMYEGEIRVPLIIKFPFSKQVGREKKMISLCDLYPTILSICGLPIPDDISGKAFGDNSSPTASEFYNFGIGEHRIIYNGKYKFMRYEYQNDPELYDLDKDPKEHENLIEKLPGITALMGKRLNDWEKAHKPKHVLSPDEGATTSELMKEQLKALGYIQ
jgi:arylsulfatase A-like enzyme